MCPLFQLVFASAQGAFAISGIAGYDGGMDVNWQSILAIFIGATISAVLTELYVAFATRGQSLITDDCPAADNAKRARRPGEKPTDTPAE